MRKSATLPPRFWLERDGQQIASLGGDHIALAAYLLTGPNSEVSGIYPLFLPEVAGRLHISAERVRQILDEICGVGWLDYDDVVGVVWVRGTGGINDQLGTEDFRRNPKWRAATEHHLARLPASRLVEAFRRHHGLTADGQGSDTLAIPYRQGIDTPSIGPPSPSDASLSGHAPGAGRRGGRQ